MYCISSSPEKKRRGEGPIKNPGKNPFLQASRYLYARRLELKKHQIKDKTGVFTSIMSMSKAFTKKLRK
jgi:hypothetical protein